MSTDAFNPGDDPIKLRAEAPATRAVDARDRGTRRRILELTKAEHGFASAERDFMQAMQEYKQSSGRMFPTWSEVLEVLRDLGYQREGGSRPPAA
jgi:hypothetical protein